MATRTLVCNTRKNNVEAVLLQETAKQYRVELMGQSIRWNKSDCTTRVETLLPPIPATNPSTNGTASVSPTATTNPSPNKESSTMPKPKTPTAPKTDGKPDFGAKETPCPVTRPQFRAGAKPVPVTIGGKEYTAVVKEFSTGSFGWNINDKVKLMVDGVEVTCQIGLNLTIANSKKVPAG